MGDLGATGRKTLNFLEALCTVAKLDRLAKHPLDKCHNTKQWNNSCGGIIIFAPSTCGWFTGKPPLHPSLLREVTVLRIPERCAGILFGKIVQRLDTMKSRIFKAIGW